MRCLFLTDSLALPRKYRTCTVTWDETYIRLLAKAHPSDEFIQAGIGGATIGDLVRQLGYYMHTEPDIVILHCGIVDCAPRALRRWELQIAGKLGLYRAIKPFKETLRRYRQLSYTSPKRFARALTEIRSIFGTRPLISIGILPGRPAYEAKVPGVTSRIDSYNAILKAHTVFIDTADFPEAGTVDDFVHLNAIGHRIVFEKVEAALERIRHGERA